MPSALTLGMAQAEIEFVKRMIFFLKGVQLHTTANKAVYTDPQSRTGGQGQYSEKRSHLKKSYGRTNGPIDRPMNRPNEQRHSKL